MYLVAEVYLVNHLTLHRQFQLVLGLVVDKDLYDQFYNSLSYLSGSDSNSDMTATYSLLQRRQRRGDSAKGQSPQYYYPQHHL